MSIHLGLNAPTWNKRFHPNRQQRILDIVVVLSRISSDFTHNFITEGAKITALFMLPIPLHKWELQNAAQSLQDLQALPSISQSRWLTAHSCWFTSFTWLRNGARVLTRGFRRWHVVKGLARQTSLKSLLSSGWGALWVFPLFWYQAEGIAMTADHRDRMEAL